MLNSAQKSNFYIFFLNIYEYVSNIDKITNMNYKAFYRTYRPSNFNEVVGQDHIVKTLINLIRMNKISHGYLFSGPRGTGKTSIAKIFANAINCIHSERPEDICNMCIQNSNKSLDIIEIDAASNNSVNDVRTIREQVEFAPTNSPYKIYIIDEVHMLTKGAFNALLMTLEEPPAHAIFIFATTNPDKIPDTILSRVQRYNFKRITKSVLKSQLISIFNKENIKFEEEAVDIIATLANGSLRDALSIADQINAYSNSNIKVNDLIQIFGLSSIDAQVHILNLMANKLVSESLSFFDELVESGVDISKLISSLIDLLKDFLVYNKTKNANIVSVEPAYLEDIILKTDRIHEILDVLVPLLNEIKYTDIPQQLVQLAIIKICSFEGSLIDIQKKEINIESLKTKTIPNQINSGDTKEYKDITDEYFSTQNVSQPIDLEQQVNTQTSSFQQQYQTAEKEIAKTQPIKEATIPDVFKNMNLDKFNQNDTDKIDLSQDNTNTSSNTLLKDYSEENIEEGFNDLMNNFSLSQEIEKLKSNSNESIQNKTAEKVIDDTTELLNISHEVDHSDVEVDESLLRAQTNSGERDLTNKQIFDTNELSVADAFNNEEENATKKEFTKEFIIEEKQKVTKPINLTTELSQPKIVNLFILAKKDTFDIFKQKLEISSCTDKEEYDSYAVLLKEVRFVCSANDFILVSSEEDWVIEDINKKQEDANFKKFIYEYYGNNVHFFAITKKDYIISKELFSELKKSGKAPEPTPLERITNYSNDELRTRENAINEVETKSKSIFGDLFSIKK